MRSPIASLSIALFAGTLLAASPSLSQFQSERYVDGGIYTIIVTVDDTGVQEGRSRVGPGFDLVMHSGPPAYGDPRAFWLVADASSALEPSTSVHLQRERAETDRPRGLTIATAHVEADPDVYPVWVGEGEAADHQTAIDLSHVDWGAPGPEAREGSPAGVFLINATFENISDGTVHTALYAEVAARDWVEATCSGDSGCGDLRWGCDDPTGCECVVLLGDADSCILPAPSAMLR